MSGVHWRDAMGARSESTRREFLGGLTATAALGAGAAAVDAQGPLTIVDFHNHFVDPSWPLTTVAAAAPSDRPRWQTINGKLQSEATLLRSMEGTGVSARVINTPTAFLEDAEGNVPREAYRRINDQVAALCAKHAGTLHGLASVDGFSGEDAARELTRAVKELHLRGVFVESASPRRGLLFGDAPTRPMLKVAADLGVPVFLHPQTDPQLHERLSRTGRLGLRLARATINSAGLINMLESGAFDEVPTLRLVVTTWAFGGLLLAGAGGNDDGARIRIDTPELMRRHVYVDKMGLHPVTVRAAVDLLGADHVLMGTDWPVADEKSIPERLGAAMAHAGLDAAQQRMVAGGNALRLLGVA
jgi:aminocarboxymuconate-semialdehyde decarboxylase